MLRLPHDWLIHLDRNVINLRRNCCMFRPTPHLVTQEFGGGEAHCGGQLRARVASR
ncbi:MAG: hypothetical protein U0840_15550 [Gemmataceae bacterium]